ncbi:lipid A deacylase LpxR family protein [Marinihelvus fidelis]|nr:lipid A deacylase LpxR family protein [Marinihelvus fidelis]
MLSTHPLNRWRRVRRLVALLALVPLLAFAQDDPVADDQADAGLDEFGGGGYLTFYLDNDLFAGEDKDYTNGARLSWISDDKPLFGVLPGREGLEKLAGALPSKDWMARLSGFDPENIENGDIAVNYGFSVTQLMFTPDDPDSPTQPPGQRRYAGWLGVGFSVHAKDESALNSVELIFGTTGPRSLAEKTQDFIHDIRDIPEFQGWDDQIPNEFTFDLAYSQKRRVPLMEPGRKGFSVDGFGEWVARLGTFQTLAGAGGFFRAGFNLPADFSDPRLSATAYSNQYFGSGKPSGSNWSAYAIFGAYAGGVFFDATLDGPLFSDFETGNTRETWIADSFLGFGVRWRMLEFSYAQTWRTKTYEEQVGNPSFGSLALRLRIDT